MSEMNSAHNRAVWFDIPVADLDRAAAFYRAVLEVGVHKEEFQGSAFCFIEHGEGNGGCLVPDPANVGVSGVLVYLNVDRRIRDAMIQVERQGGKTLEP